MTKAARMAQSSAQGGFHLFWGLAVSTIISSVGIILIARLLTPEDYGLYSIAFMAPNLIVVFRNWGVNSAMIRYLSQYRAEGKTDHVKGIIVAGHVFEILVGSALFLLSFVLSGFLATNIFQRPTITLLIQIASSTIFTEALLTAAQSVFIGLEAMRLNSLILILQSTVKTALSALLILVGYGVFGALLGAVIAILAAGTAAVALLYVFIYRPLKQPHEASPATIPYLKLMVKYGLPLSLSTILTGFATQFYSILMAMYCSNQAIGNYQAALNFAVLASFFSTPITTILFPAFSKLDARNEPDTLKTTFQYSVKYASLLVLPLATAIMALSRPIVSTLFGNQYATAPLYLTLYSIIYLFTAFGNLSIANLLNSQGETKATLKLTLLTTAVGLMLSLLLIPPFGILGLITVGLVSGVPSLFLGLTMIKTRYNATIHWRSSAKILVASGLAAGVAYLPLLFLALSSWIALFLGLALFTIAYLLFIPLFHALERNDITYLRDMLKDLGPIGHVATLLLKILDQLLTLTHHQ